jgi:predicted PurR-regulated permease PerM
VDFEPGDEATAPTAAAAELSPPATSPVTPRSTVADGSPAAAPTSLAGSNQPSTTTSRAPRDLPYDPPTGDVLGSAPTAASTARPRPGASAQGASGPVPPTAHDPRSAKDPSLAAGDEAIAATAERESRWRHPSIDPRLAISALIGVAGGLLLAQVAAAVFAQLRTLIAIVVVSLFLSFAMEPAVQWLARRGLRRGLGTAIVLSGVLLTIGGFVAAMLPMILDQVTNLIAAAPRILREIGALAESLPGELGDATAAWLDEQRRELPARTNEYAGAIGRGAVGFGQSLVGGVFQLATIGLVTFYLVADAPKLRRTLASRLDPREQVRVLGLWELALAKTGGYVYSRALTAIVSSVFHVAAFALIGLDYAVALGVWVGLISSLIPAIGTYLAGALPVVVALAASPSQALWVLITITAYQQIENYVLVPKITASTMELHPAIAFLAVLGGAALGGATGALLAIPAVAIATALISSSAEEYEVLEHSLLETGVAEVAEVAIELREEANPTAGPGAGGPPPRA